MGLLGFISLLSGYYQKSSKAFLSLTGCEVMGSLVGDRRMTVFEPYGASQFLVYKECGISVYSLLWIHHTCNLSLFVFFFNVFFSFIYDHLCLGFVTIPKHSCAF